jgi:hypothetical protein
MNGQQGLVRAPAPAPAAGAVARQGFGSQEIEQRAESSIAAAAEQARALVNAKCIMALQRPRDWKLVRDRVLDDCRRPRFAEEAKYLKPIGKGVAGPSVRFAEACARQMGNLWRTAHVTYEDAFKRHVLVSVMDLETNLTLDEEVVIEKTVERSSSNDRVVVGQRTNSFGKTVYIVQATDDDLLNKVNALKSKASRNLILAFVPADIVEEAMDLVEATKLQTAGAAGAREKMVRAFATLRVTVQDIEAWLGHAVDAVTPDEMAQLRDVYNAMDDGEGTWADHIEARRAARAQGATGAPASTAPPTPAASSPPPATPPPAPVAAPATPAPQSEAGPPAQDATAPTSSPPTYASGGPAEGMSAREKEIVTLVERIEAADSMPALNKLAAQVRAVDDAEVLKAYGQRKAALTSGGVR